MKRGRLFELSLILLLLLLLACLLYVIMTSAAPKAEVSGWSIKDTWSPNYITIGSNDTLYEFKANQVYGKTKDPGRASKGMEEIRAIGNNGSQLWSLEISTEWSVLNQYNLPGHSPEGYGYSLYDYPVMAESDGSLYLFAFKRLTWEDINALTVEKESELNISYNNTSWVYTRPADQYIRQPSKVMKISPEGRVTWEYTFNVTMPKWDIGGLCEPEYFIFDRPVKIDERSGHIYVFHDFTEDVLDQDGRLLFSIGNISDPAVIDSIGHMYAIKGTILEATADSIVAANGQPLKGEADDWYTTIVASDPEFLLPTGVVEAYDSEGKLLWSTDIGHPAVRQLFKYDVWSQYYTLPLCANDTLYVPIRNGVATLSKDGKLKWSYLETTGEYVLYEIMPLDSKGNTYLRKAYPAGTDCAFLMRSNLTVIGPDGRADRNPWPFFQDDPVIGKPDAPRVIGGYDGIIYATGALESTGLSMIDSKVFDQIYATKRFPADTITAYDVKSHTALWRFTIPESDVHTLTLDRNNLATNIQYTSGQMGVFNGSHYIIGDIKTEAYPLKPYSSNTIRVLPGENGVYINYYYSAAEIPLISNLSRCVYANGLYSLDNRGRLLWEQQIDGFVTDVLVNNSTMYYRTSDGTIGKGTVNVMAGIAILAMIAIVLRFLAVGAVSRAKSRLDKNENRNQVLDYIIAHPGSTTYEIVRGLKMNLGTIRYHLLVLSLNHKIVAHQDGSKYVRYFKNSGSFTQEERSLLSLMRREPVRRTLKVLAQKPGISGAELSKELGISDTAAYKNVNMLVEKGIVSRETRGDRGYIYSVIDEYRPFIAGGTER